MQTVVITGANAGVGYQTAVELARTGARVVMACRNMEKAHQAQRDLLAEVPGAETVVLELDVSEPASIETFAREVASRLERIDTLVNNAGIFGTPLARNSLGHEMQLATNYLGAFALTGRLLPLLRTDAPARIVNVGSLAHRVGKLDLADLNWERTPYGEWQGYARSKVALLCFTLELNRRLVAQGSKVVAVGAHPGFAATEIARNHAVVGATSPVRRWLTDRIEPLIPSAADAARPILHAACDDDVAGGDYFGPGGFLEIGGRPGKARVNPIAKDAELAGRLWELSEAMTGVRYLSGERAERASGVDARS